MRIKHFAYLALCLMIFATSSAQIFNLEEEGSRTTRGDNSTPPESVSAVDLPVIDESGRQFLESTYQNIAEKIREKRIPEAFELLNKTDIITKQKLLDRLIKENPE